MKPELLTLLSDPYFSAFSALFVLLAASLLFFAGKCARASREEPGGGKEASPDEEAEEKPAGEESSAAAGEEDAPGEYKGDSSGEAVKTCSESPDPAGESGGHFKKAEAFVEGLYTAVSGMDVRIRAIEKKLAENKINSDFALNMVDSVLDEYESLDKDEIKKRLEILSKSLKG